MKVNISNTVKIKYDIRPISFKATLQNDLRKIHGKIIINFILEQVIFKIDYAMIENEEVEDFEITEFERLEILKEIFYRFSIIFTKPDRHDIEKFKFIVINGEMITEYQSVIEELLKYDEKYFNGNSKKERLICYIKKSVVSLKNGHYNSYIKSNDIKKMKKIEKLAYYFALENYLYKLSQNNIMLEHNIN